MMSLDDGSPNISNLTLRFEGHGIIVKPNGSHNIDWFPIVCGHCGTHVSAAVVARDSNSKFQDQLWVQCTNCAKGSIVFGIQPLLGDAEIRVYPGQRSQPNIEGLPTNIQEAYDEARDCISVNAFTGCELLCRKIIMYVAVESAGAKEGKTFAEYLGNLEKSGYITPPMKNWVDHIRKRGNAATHELVVPTSDDANGTLEFTALLLRLIYETAKKAAKFTPAQP